MTVSMTVQKDDRHVLEMLGGMLSRMENTTPVMRIIGEVVRTSVERNFAAEGRPAWKPSRRAAEEGGQTLSLTGRLRRSINVAAGNGWTVVGTNVIYAAIHQFGGTTPARVIEPKHKKALRTPYGIFKRVKHPGSKIPARPFLVVQDEDWVEIKAAVAEYLTKQK